MKTRITAEIDAENELPLRRAARAAGKPVEQFCGELLEMAAFGANYRPQAVPGHDGPDQGEASA